MSNSVTFVSLGPGEPELITLKGLKNLQQANLIFCPSTTLNNGGSHSRAMNILLALNIEKEKLVLFDVPMNKDRSLAIESYKSVSEQIIEKYRAGQKIAVVAEGDAGFYSSVHYISDELVKKNIPIQRIAGIPAFVSCGALANIHIAKQEEELHVVPEVIASLELINKVENGTSVVIMKTSQSETEIKKAMNSLPTALFHYFENVGVTGKEFYTQDRNEIQSRTFPYFSLIIIQKQ